MYPVKEAALVGGEPVSYQLDAAGAVKYLEIKPTEGTTTAERTVAVYGRCLPGGSLYGKPDAARPRPTSLHVPLQDHCGTKSDSVAQ